MEDNSIVGFDEEISRHGVMTELDSFEQWRQWPVPRLMAFIALVMKRNNDNRDERMKAHETRYSGCMQKFDE